MEVFGVQSENLACVWNDVALLTDQRAYTFVCKTMLQIPEQAVETLQDILLVDWHLQPGQDVPLHYDGAMCLQARCAGAQSKQEELQLIVPLQAEMAEPLAEQATGRLLYSKAKAAGDSLLLETVLQIERQQSVGRSQVVLGPFQMKELLELPVPWPDCQTLVATTAALQIQKQQIEQGQLQVEGAYQLDVVYHNETQPGECLFAYEQLRPVQFAIPVPAGLQELERVVPYYQSVTAQLLDDRQILLEGEGVLCAAEADVLTETADSACDVVCPVRKAQAQAKPRPSVVNSRGSRLANLSKYMRNLNSSVQSPKFTRNFEFGADQPDHSAE